ncbi:MAG: YIP1 family protein [Epulopiscium sp.]|nr:YIP1 family protein [Candidatus Epulonipiscium sp.]
MQVKKPMNLFQKIIKIFVAPNEVLQDIKESPRILIPFFYVFVITILTTILQKPMIELQQQEISYLSLERYGVDMLSLSGKGLTNNQSFWISLFSIPVGVWLGWLISSVILLMVSKILKGKSTYKQLLSLVIHTAMLTSTLVLIVTPIDLFLGRSSTVFSLAVLYPGGNMTSFVYNLLSVMTLFSIWAVIFQGMGLYILNEFSKKKGYITAIFLYIGKILFAAGAASMTFWMFDILYKQGIM